MAQQKQQNKDTNELLQSLVTTSLTKKKQKQTASKSMGYLPEVLFFNAFEQGMKMHQVLSRSKSYNVGLKVLSTIHCMLDRKSTRLNSSHSGESRMPSSA